MHIRVLHSWGSAATRCSPGATPSTPAAHHVPAKNTRESELFSLHCAEDIDSRRRFSSGACLRERYTMRAAENRLRFRKTVAATRFTVRGRAGPRLGPIHG